MGASASGGSLASRLGSGAEQRPGRPLLLVFVAYLFAVLLPSVGMLFGLVVLSRNGRWARIQGGLVIFVSGFVLAMGLSLGPALVESAFPTPRAQPLSPQLESTFNRVQRETAAFEREHAAIRARWKRSEADAAQTPRHGVLSR